MSKGFLQVLLFHQEHRPNDFPEYISANHLACCDYADHVFWKTVQVQFKVSLSQSCVQDLDSVQLTIFNMILEPI